MGQNGVVIVAAADGSSLANPGPSGWAWYIDDAHWAAGGWARGTNNMGELMSVLDLLRSTRGVEEPLRVLCDSQYAINCCTRWIPAWKKRGWRKADNKPVLNLDLVKELDEELAGRAVTFQWVRGHTGHPLNERADSLARAAATAYQQGTPVASGPGYTKVPPTTTHPPAVALRQAQDPQAGVARDAETPAVTTQAVEQASAGERCRNPLTPTPAVAPAPAIEQAGAARGAPHDVRQPSPWPQQDEQARPALGPRRGVETPAVASTPPVVPPVLPVQPEPPAPLEPLQPDLLSVTYPTRTPPRPQPDTALVVDITGLTRELLSDDTQLDRERFGELLHPDFVAHLPGGVIRTRGSLLARPARLGGTIQLDVLGADHFGDDLVLLRFKLRRNSQDFLGAVLWQYAGTWSARFLHLTPLT